MISTSSKTKCVLHLVHGYNEPFFSLANHYANTLRREGWRVVTIYLTGPESETIRNASIADKVIFFEAAEKEMKGLKFALIMQARKILAEENPALIIAQRYKPIYLALLASLGNPIPVLGVSHAFGLLDSAGRRLLTNLYRHRLILAGVSDAVAQDMREAAPSLKIITLHNCLDADGLEPRLLSRQQARQRLGLDESAFVFGNVGRLHKDKDQATLIRAFAALSAHHPLARLILVGRGKNESAYRQLIAGLGMQDKVLMPGPVADAATLFRAFDAYVSASDREPFGIVLTEAMLARLPVISTDCGGAPEVLGEHALYFRRGDHETLSAQMAEMIHMTPTQREERGQALYCRLRERFTPPPFARRLLAAIAAAEAP